MDRASSGSPSASSSQTPRGSPRKDRGLLGLTAIPLLVAATTLLRTWLTPDASDRWWLVATLGCLVVHPAVLVFQARGLSSRAFLARLVALPALLAPLAVAFPWTVTPSHFGIGVGDFGFFLHWLTKYPTFGPVNLDVLLGIGCVLGCAFLPWLSAALALCHQSSRITRGVLLGLALIPYIPALIKLDAQMFLFGLISVFMPAAPAPSIWVVIGPLIRLTAILSMIGIMLERPCASPDPESPVAIPDQLDG